MFEHSSKGHGVINRSTRNHAIQFIIGIVISLSSYHVTPGWAQEGGLTIRAIEVRGNQHIDEAAIQARLTLKIGDLITSEATREQIRRIYDLGFFEDVQVQTEPAPEGGASVLILVKENPFISELVFDGNSHLSNDKLQEKISIRTQAFLDQQQVKESADTIRQAYREEGYYNVEVIPIVQTIEGSQKRLTFFIQEQERARIRTVNFDGLTAIRKQDVLSALATREYVPVISWITDAGILKQEEIPNDVERIKEVYMNKGYLDVQVGMPNIDLSEDKQWFTVTFPIVEGAPYTIKTVDFEGNTVFEDQELRQGLSFQSGDVFQRAKLRNEIARMTDLYGEKGYSFAEVTPSLRPNRQNLNAEITFTIKEGELIRVRQINITGNNRTRDNVIRRELRVSEQAVINSSAIKRSFQRLNNLNFFETVEILPEQIEEDMVDLEVKVKEKSTGSFSVGGGFSTLDQLTAIANITEGNLFGRGYMVRIRGQVGGRRTLGVLTFRNPALWDSLTAFQADGFSTDTNFLTYRQKKSGGTVRLGRSFSEYISGTFSLVGEHIKVQDVDADASQIIQDQEGTQSTTGFRATLFRDTRDYFLDPRKGIRAGVRAGFGTELLGGTNDFYTIALDAIKYTPLPWGDLRHAIRGRIGYGEGFSGDSLPISEFFFVGGINTVRGFEFGRAGPVSNSGTLEGGNRQLILNNELIFPLLSEAKLNGVLFFDYGEGFEEGQSLNLNLRSSAGLEVRWISPFGPLRMAWGLNLDPKGDEKKSVFEFSVGNVF